MLLPRVTYDLSATPRGRPYDVVTQLRGIPAHKSSLLEVHPAQGMTTWVPTHAPQPLVTRPGSISTFLSHHACRLPLGRGPLPGCVCPSGSPKVACTAASIHLMYGYFTIQVTPCRYWEYGLEATFPFSLLLILRYRGLLPCRPLHGLPYPWVSGGGPSYLWACPMVLPPPRSFLPVGIGRWHPSDVSAPWFRPSQRPRLVNAQGLTIFLLLSLCPWWVPPNVDFGQHPRTGRYRTMQRHPDAVL